VKHIKDRDGVIHLCAMGDATAFESLLGVFQVQLQAVCANVSVVAITTERATCLTCLAQREQ
jgi:hypothetical protein